MHKRIAVVSGGLGYIGKNLCAHLKQKGWHVILLVRKESSLPSDYDVKSLHFVEFDGSVESLLPLKVFDRDKTVFFHLAAFADFETELETIERSVESNTVFGVKLATFLARSGFKFLISTETYWQFNRVGDLNNNSIYSVGKNACSLFLEYFGRTHLRIISLVLYDVFGPNDPRGKILNSLIEATFSSRQMDLTEGKQIMDYVYIDDVVSAYEIAANQIILSASTPAFSRYAVRSMRPLSLRGYLALVEQVFGHQLEIRWGARAYPPHQIMDPWLPSSEFKLPGWEPKISFEAGIRRILIGE